MLSAGALRFLRLLAAMTSAAGAAACSSRRVEPSPRWTFGAAAPSAAAAPAPSARPAASSCVDCAKEKRPPDPEASRLFLQSYDRPSRAFGPASDPPPVTVAALENTALGAALLRKPASELLASMLQEGERASTPFTIAPGECATFVAHGGLGAVELDMFLTAAGATAAPEILAEDASSGPIAVVGGGDGCIRSRGSAPLKAELHVRMRRGAGLVLVRGYQR